MATGDQGKRIRGSTDLKLSPEGREQIKQLSVELNKRGGLWRMYSSTQSRAVETAHLVVKHSHATRFMMPSASLESWALGHYEGKLISEALPHIKALVAKKPWVVPVGMGLDSTRVGESFNQFKTRVIDEVRRIMDVWLEHPTKRIGVVTHFHDCRLVEAWLAKYKGDPGPNDDLYDANIYNEDRGAPGDVFWLRKQNGIWKYSQIYIDKLPEIPLPPGVYFIRHAMTSWN